MYFAILILLIICLIIWYVPWWTEDPGISYVADTSLNRNLTSGNVQYLGEATDSDACQKLCNNAEWCNAYTWNNQSTADQGCYGMGKRGKTAKGGPYISGQKLNGFEPKLMHMFGMDSAGAPESMTINVPGRAEGMAINVPGARQGFVNVPGKAEGMAINVPGARQGFVNVPGRAEGMAINVPGARQGFVNVPGRAEGMAINVPGARQGFVNVPGRAEGMAINVPGARQGFVNVPGRAEGLNSSHGQGMGKFMSRHSIPISVAGLNYAPHTSSNL